MGLGKTFTGAEKLIQLRAKVNLVICQKSKINDWVEHFATHYQFGFNATNVYDLTKKTDYEQLFKLLKANQCMNVLIINYELAFRRKELLELTNFTLMLDESSMIQNETAKRTKFILKMKPKNIILLSGTPTSGKYEKLWSQLHLLGWKISKDLFWKQYIDVEYLENQGFPIKVVRGYKNVERLKQKMREYGCRFLKTDEVFDLPKQLFNTIKIDTTKEYRKFRKDRIVSITTPIKTEKNECGTTYSSSLTQFVGDTTLTKMLYERMLCGSYNDEKLSALEDLINSTEDRLIVFYNFNEELRKIEDICLKLDKPLSIVNGQTKDLSIYDTYDNSVTAIQYQAGAMGLNLQKANKIIYFTPTLSSELFEQSKKRIHRLKQERPCFYYLLTCRNSIEERIYETLEKRRDFTNELFRELEKD